MDIAERLKKSPNSKEFERIQAVPDFGSIGNAHKRFGAR